MLTTTWIWLLPVELQGRPHLDGADARPRHFRGCLDGFVQVSSIDEEEPDELPRLVRSAWLGPMFESGDLMSRLTEVIRAKNLNDLGLAVSDDLAEAFAPFDGLVQ